MTSARSLTRLVVVASIGATVALLISGLAPARDADARKPPRVTCQDDLRHHKAELARMESELSHYRAAYEALNTGLDRVERLNQQNAGKARTQIRQAIQRARSRASQHVVQVPTYPQPEHRPAPTHPVKPAPYRPAGRVISSRDFRSLLATVQQASFDQDRVRIVTEAARHHAFTVAQVMSLMKSSSFENTRIDIAATLYPAVADRQNWFQVYGALSFSSSHQTLQDRIR